MDPVRVSTTIDRPREEVFAYLADVANHSEFLDHFCDEFRLTREETTGRGAGARFRLRSRLLRFGWADLTIVTADAPRLLVLAGRMGKFNRNRMLVTWTLEPSSGCTRVTLETETEPAKPSDRLLEAIGGRRWTRRRTAKALRRLRSILEEGRKRGRRATIAGGPRKPATPVGV
jgi:uncharacterized protein YndB with AHSA1/START domain